MDPLKTERFERQGSRGAAASKSKPSTSLKCLVVSTERQRGHAPLAEIESSGSSGPLGAPRSRRCDSRRAGRATSRFDLVGAPAGGTPGGDRSGARSRAGPLPRTRVERLSAPSSRHARRGARRVPRCPASWRGIGSFLVAAGGDRPGTRQVVLRDHDAHHGGHLRRRPFVAVDVASSATRRRDPRGRLRLRTLPAARTSRPTAMFGGYCYLQQRGDRRAHATRRGAAVRLDVDYHHGNGTQQIFYDRDDVCSCPARRPRREYPFFLGFDDEWGDRTGEWRQT